MPLVVLLRSLKSSSMALLKCPECGRDVSCQAATCPHCGFPLPIAVTAQAPAPPILVGAQSALSSTPPFLTRPQAPPILGSCKSPKTRFLIGTGVAVSMVVFVMLTVALIVVEPPPHKEQSVLPKTVESFDAGYAIGQIEGFMAYNGGHRRATDQELDGPARALTAHIVLNTQSGRADWIRGYKVGYSLGWDRAEEK